MTYYDLGRYWIDEVLEKWQRTVLLRRNQMIVSNENEIQKKLFISENKNKITLKNNYPHLVQSTFEKLDLKSIKYSKLLEDRFKDRSKDEISLFLRNTLFDKGTLSISIGELWLKDYEYADGISLPIKTKSERTIERDKEFLWEKDRLIPLIDGNYELTPNSFEIVPYVIGFVRFLKVNIDALRELRINKESIVDYNDFINEEYRAHFDKFLEILELKGICCIDNENNFISHKGRATKKIVIVWLDELHRSDIVNTDTNYDMKLEFIKNHIKGFSASKDTFINRNTFKYKETALSILKPRIIEVKRHIEAMK